MKNLKDYREKELKMYVIGCLLLCICLNEKMFLQFELKGLKSLINLLGPTLISGVICIFTYTFDSLYPIRFKESLISIFGKMKKPAYSVFTDIKTKNRDDRISTDKALKKYKYIYDEIGDGGKETGLYQNEKWNEIYSKHRDVPMIFVSNRDYLLCRDMFFSTFTIGILYAASVIIGLLNCNVFFIAFLIIMLAISFSSTHIKARRFVNNVIAYDLSKKEIVSEDNSEITIKIGKEGIKCQ